MEVQIKHLITRKLSKVLLLIPIFFLILSKNSQASSKIVKGYIISQTNDTLYRQIQVEADIFGQFNEIKLYHEVMILNENGLLQLMTPADIKGFGFNYKDKQYSFISKPLDKNGKSLFVEPLITGKRAQLYLYKELSYMTNEYRFTVEKQDGTFLRLSDFASLENFRQQLKSFFGDDKDAISLIESSFRAHSKIEKDISNVVRQVNHEQSPMMATTK
jgi:hypothetical protein